MRSVVGTSEQGVVTKTRNLQSQGDFQSREHWNQDLGRKEVAVQSLETVYFRQREGLGKYPNQGTNLAEG